MRDAGPFYGWLLRTQIAPVFRAHPYVRRALVLIIPQVWERPPRRAGRMLILYSANDPMSLDATMDAFASDSQDPALPEGVSNYDLYLPIVGEDDESGGRDAPPFVFFERESFLGLTRDPEYGHHAVFDAFAMYASFVRGEDGEVTCVGFDAQLSERIDRVM